MEMHKDPLQLQAYSRQVYCLLGIEARQDYGSVNSMQKSKTWIPFCWFLYFRFHVPCKKVIELYTPSILIILDV